MANIKDILNNIKNTNGEFRNPVLEPSNGVNFVKNRMKVSPPDTRSRAERKEDLENSLAKINKVEIQLVVNILNSIKDDNDLSSDEKQVLASNFELIKLCVQKFEQTIETYEKLNSDKSRHVELKKEEHILNAKYDFKEKLRVFGFRILGSILLIFTLFAIGTIDAKYEDLHLPLSRYVNNTTSIKTNMPTNYSQSMPAVRYIKVEN